MSSAGSNVVAKICNFGFACARQEGATMTHCGSLLWTAPKIIGGKPYNKRTDVYLFGIVMWEVLKWRIPYTNDNFMQVLIAICNGQ